MSAIGELTSTLLNVARGGIGLVAGYGIVKFIEGRASEDVKTSNDGLAITLVACFIEALTFAVEKILT